ncbi:hypothetical protein [Rhizobium sp. 18065]|uniref:hypothetical protein n=1 Tax=Rhizobium sp. 18065 TaxID=2681411 RepID=UPI0013589DE2|nr:hypothetical protein [Rhizobium sp. 18065]
MIALPVRNTRLIALPTHASPLSSQGSITGIFGFAEEEPLCFDRTTRPWRGSATQAPQGCGKRQAKFDPAGMADWLRKAFPQSTCHHIEARTGIAAATIENWLLRRSQPSVEHFSTLIAVFGPALLAACMERPPGWVARAADGERARQLDEEIARLRSERDALERSA